MVESVALEMRSAGNGTEGSNPSLSSIFSISDHMAKAAPTMVETASARYRMVIIVGAVSAATTAPTIRNSTIAATITTTV